MLTIARVCVNGLEEAESDPDVDGEDVEIAEEVAVEKRAGEGAGAEDEDLCGVGVLGGKAERRRVLVVDFVNVLVQRAEVKGLVR